MRALKQRFARAPRARIFDAAAPGPPYADHPPLASRFA
jgi:hypothetical protein